MKILVIDDEKNMRHMLTALLSKEGYKVESAADGVVGAHLVKVEQFDFVLCDIKMPVMDGMAFLKKIAASGVDVPVIMMSAFGSVETAIKAMKHGAYDYISKPFNAEEIVLVLKKAEERERLRRENRLLKKKVVALESSLGFGSMIGKSKGMQSLFQLAEKVAKHPTTVLVTGESGTGKELVARGIHKASSRAEKPFIAVNCGSIPENLLESELFGYVKGAFTGADSNRTGLFEEADHGTLFLDEIGELPLSMQVKLLRTLQENEIRRVGATRNKTIDVRVITATAKNLEEEVAGGGFREDLFYRLNVINIHIPPLRERVSDISLLCDHFLHRLAAQMNIDPVPVIDHDTMRIFMEHGWPGNVRELENVIERAIILCNEGRITPENLPENLSKPLHNRRIDDFLGTLSLKKGRKLLEQRFIARALERTQGNKSKAAELLEMSYPSLLHKIKEYGSCNSEGK